MWFALKSKKKKDHISLFPHVSNDWALDLSKKGTYGVVQAAIARMETRFGFPKQMKVHSARNWFATCAGQLLYGREHREKLGRWAPGSIMPDHYDRAECATELRLWAEIIEKVQSGWRPSKAFEVPGFEMQREDEERQRKENESTDSEMPDTSETSLPEVITDLYDYV